MKYEIIRLDIIHVYTRWDLRTKTLSRGTNVEGKRQKIIRKLSLFSPSESLTSFFKLLSISMHTLLNGSKTKRKMTLV